MLENANVLNLNIVCLTPFIEFILVRDIFPKRCQHAFYVVLSLDHVVINIGEYFFRVFI